MRVFIRLVAAMVLSAGALAIAQQPAGKAYPIKLERPFAAGQFFTMTIVDTTRTTKTLTMADSADNRTESFRRVTLQAEVAIDQVDKDGNHTAMRLKVQDLSMQNTSGSTSATPRKVLPAGTEMTVKYEGGQPQFALKSGTDVPLEAVDALRQLFPPRVEQKVDDDDRYGSKEPRKVGERWPINMDAMVPDKTAPQSLDPGQTKGTVLLKGTRTLVDIEAMQLEVAIIGTVVGTGAKEYTMNITVNTTLPVDLTKPVLAKTVKALTHMVVETDTLAGNKRRETADVSLEHDTTWLPSAKF